MIEEKLFIAGQWVAAAARLPVEDPSTGETIGTLAAGKAGDIDAAVGAAQDAFSGAWGAATAAERGRVLAKIGKAVETQADMLAELEARDVGKPLKQARADALALARYLEFYAGAADKLHGETIPYLAGYTVYTLREPHGVTGHIIPWNYPMQIIGRSVVGALAAGNAAVVKPAEEASLTALAFARIADEAGLPAGALNIVTGLGEEAGAALAGHPGVHHISFTGSTAVGALIQAAAGRNAVPVTLELGGKSPQIVFADADLDRALPFLVNAGIQNAGQTCSASSRLLLERPIYDQLLDRLAARYRALKVGAARDDLDVGPLISAAQKKRVESYIARGRGDGLAVVAEGAIASNAPSGGHFLPPTLFAGVAPDHVLAQDEIFGPVQVAIPFDSEEEAIRIANGTEYGLVAGIWTRDGSRALRLSRAVRAGQVFVNNYGAGGGVELPFGGTGRSGHGREKGFEALYAFTRLKTVAAFHG
ncbi:MAG: aldehyde dehydrogenase family protein [Alphaproteobacteria bacterium]|nr:aldehyde dehydrogenase family protein [Alphaproteobacteria bacterium]